MPFWISLLAVCVVGAQASDFARNALSLVGIHTLFGGIDSTGLHRVADGTGSGCRTSRLGEVKVAIVRNTPIVTVLANGEPVDLILDTGAESTILTDAAAKRIGAHPPQIAFQAQIRGLTSILQAREMEVRSFAAGDVTIPWRRIRVAPVNMPNLPRRLDGVFGADSLSSFDIEFDLPHRRMVLYGQQICAGAAPAWIGPYDTIVTGRSRSYNLFFPVRLDGHKLDAFIDTGSQVSVLSATAAHVFGVTNGGTDASRTGTLQGVAGEQLKAQVHRFSELEIGGQVLRNPELLLADVSLRDGDLVLGVDFLSARRVWFSYGVRRIFVSRGP